MAVATFVEPNPLSFGNGLACSSGYPSPYEGSTPSEVECTGAQPYAVATPTPGGTGSGPYILKLSASGSGTGTSLSLHWASAPYQAQATLTPCPTYTAWGMDQQVQNSAPFFDDLGDTYLSDRHSYAVYTPNGSNSVGTCGWGLPNPNSASIISWNAVALAGAGTPTPTWYLVGQGRAGPVMVQAATGGTPVASMPLANPQGTPYVTYNTVAAVQAATGGGARLYDSTGLCTEPGGACTHASDPLAVEPGRLYAIDVLPPSGPGQPPTLQEAWSYDFAGPSGASPMVIPGPSSGSCTAPCGDHIYFDGGGTTCTPACPTPQPLLFGVQDNCPFGQACATPVPPATLTPVAPLFTPVAVGATVTPAAGTCAEPTATPAARTYYGLQAAPVRETPELSGSDPNDSVWVHAACGAMLYRFDAQTGQPWPSTGGGQSSIELSTISLGGQTKYVAGSTMQTVYDPKTGHTVAFLGVNKDPESTQSYLLALDLETGKLLWSVPAPVTLHAADSPFHGQFPIAETADGTYVLIAAQAGAYSGGSILGIPLG